MSKTTKRQSTVLTHFKSKTLSIEERLAKGKALRTTVPRKIHAAYSPSAKRQSPVAILQKQAKNRLPDLVPIRYARMLASPFAFLRGAAAIMAADLSGSAKTTGLQVQACGDMHVANFGVFASAERNLIFGISDFDETLPGPWEWDLKRLTTSIVSCGEFLGIDKSTVKESVFKAVSSYRKQMQEYASMGNLELWYTSLNHKVILKALPAASAKRFEKILESAQKRTHLQVLEKLSDIADEKYRLKVNAPFIVRPTHTQGGIPIAEALGLFLESYLESLAYDRKELLSRYRITDAVRKVVGVGSVGTRCWIIMLRGRHQDDPLFLQLKEAEPSVLEPYLGKSQFSNNGRRVVEGQRFIQGAPDIFLGWGEIEKRHFYVRQLRDMKGGAEFDPEHSQKHLAEYSALCGWALALAHARSGDPAMISGYVGKNDELDEAMYKFSMAYAQQTNKDYKELAEAAKNKKIPVIKE